MSTQQPSLFENQRLRLDDALTTAGQLHTDEEKAAISGAKKCSKCHKEKPYSEYKNDRSRKDGRYPQCRECERQYRIANADKIKARKRSYRIDNSEKIKAQKAEFYKEHREELKAKAHKRYLEHRDAIIAAVRKYRKDNPDRVKASSRLSYLARREKLLEYLKDWRSKNKDHIAFLDRNYRQTHREERREYEREYYKKNPHVEKSKKHRRRARIKTGGSFSSGEFRELCEKYGARCLRCREPKKLTPDHVIPLSKGGGNTIDNIQPLCLDCNISKGVQCTDYRTTVDVPVSPDAIRVAGGQLVTQPFLSDLEVRE